MDRKWMGRVILLCLLILLSTLIVSCGYVDIDKRFFVVSIGVDKSKVPDKKYRVTLKLAIPQADAKSGQEQFILVHEETDSITDAVRKTKAKVDKELDFTHAKMIIFSEDVAKQDMRSLMDWFMRRRDIQKIAWLAVGKPSAEEILSLMPRSERLPSNALFLSFGGTGTESAYIISEYLFSFNRSLLEKGLDPILPLIEVIGKEQFAINKSVVFDKRKLFMELNSEETKIFNLITNRIEETDLKVDRSKSEFFFLDVDEAKAKYKILSGALNKSRVRVDLQLEGNLEEVSDGTVTADKDAFQKKAEETVRLKILHLLKKLQKAHLDPIGLGLRYRGTHFEHKDWEEWDAMYSDLEFDVHVEVTIQGTGGLH